MEILVLDFVLQHVDFASAEQLGAVLVEGFGDQQLEREGVCIIQAVATAKELAEMVKRLEKFGIKELVQSGLIALELGAKTLAEQTAIETGLASSDSHEKTQDYQN